LISSNETKTKKYTCLVTTFMRVYDSAAWESLASLKARIGCHQQVLQHKTERKEKGEFLENFKNKGNKDPIFRMQEWYPLSKLHNQLFISPFMSLIGFGLGMIFFFTLSAGKSRFQTTNPHIFMLVGKVLARRWFLAQS
jgi:hypothetical protein